MGNLDFGVVVSIDFGLWACLYVVLGFYSRDEVISGRRGLNPETTLNATIHNLQMFDYRSAIYYLPHTWPIMVHVGYIIGHYEIQ